MVQVANHAINFIGAIPKTMIRINLRVEVVVGVEDMVVMRLVVPKFLIGMAI